MKSVKPSKVKRVIINTKNAPQAIGPYNQAVLVDRTLYISGQLGMDPDTMELVDGGVKDQAIQALKNMHMILSRAKSSFSDVIKTTILLKDIKDFQTVNEIYAQCFSDNLPARAAFQVAALPKNGLVEIEAVAVVGSNTAGSILEMKSRV